MAKIRSPFRDVTCPICGTLVSCKTDESALIRHIKDVHPTALIRDLIRALFQELKLDLPKNINEVSNEELIELLAKMYLYKATKIGLKELQRKILIKQSVKTRIH
jgi:hypothetical protein